MFPQRHPPQLLLQHQLQQQPQIPQPTTIPQLQQQQHDDLWEHIDTDRFVCDERIKKTGLNNGGICKKRSKKHTGIPSIAKWGGCTELENLKKVQKGSKQKHVVTLLDGECPRDLSGRAWMVMPMAHATLLDILKNRQARKTSTWIREDVCSAIQFLHEEHELVHNDIKPDNNLIYSNPPRAVLTDFGLSENVGTV